jgi:hypothetical protein
MLEKYLRMPIGDLKRDTEDLIKRERLATVDLLWHLAALDRRWVEVESVYPSLYVYCTRRLGLSEGASYRRIHAARAMADYPIIGEQLESGKVHLSAISMIAPHLTETNCAELLDKVAGKTKREIEIVVATLAPKGDSKDVIVRLHSPQEDLEIRSAERVRFAFCADHGFLKRFDRARDLLWHKFPEGRLEDIFDDAIEALLDKRDPDRRILRKLARRPRVRPQDPADDGPLFPKNLPS